METADDSAIECVAIALFKRALKLLREDHPGIPWVSDWRNLEAYEQDGYRRQARAELKIRTKEECP